MHFLFSLSIRTRKINLDTRITFFLTIYHLSLTDVLSKIYISPAYFPNFADTSADSGVLRAPFYNNEFLEAVSGNISNHCQSALHPGTDVLKYHLQFYFNLLQLQ